MRCSSRLSSWSSALYLYINNISTSTNSAPRLYADDTCLILQDDIISNLKYTIKGEINAVNQRMIANKLTYCTFSITIHLHLDSS